MPAAVGSLNTLEVFSANDNTLSGPIPTEFGQLDSLDTLQLQSNSLSGHLPSTLGNLRKLITLDLGENQLDGPIPEAYGNLTRLETLLLQNNQLSGALPLSLTGLSNLSRFWFIGSALQTLCAPADAAFRAWLNTIPDVLGPDCQPGAELYGDYEALLALYNATDGENWTENSGWSTTVLPSPISEGDLAGWSGIVTSNDRVTEINLSSNNLTGTIPSELEKLTGLSVLDLSENNLSGGHSR